MARRVVAQASFSWTCGPIHLLAPYGAVSHTKGWAADLTRPLRLAAGAAIHLPSKGRQDGWVQMASVGSALARFHITGAPLRGGSIPPKSQSKAGVPHSGVAPIPLHIATASGW